MSVSVDMESDVMSVVNDNEAVPWQSDLPEGKTDDLPVEGRRADLIVEEGATGYTSVITDQPGSQGTTDPQLLEACAEAVVQQSLEGKVSNISVVFITLANKVNRNHP